MSCLVKIELAVCGVDTYNVHDNSKDDENSCVYSHGVVEVGCCIKVVVEQACSKCSSSKLYDCGDDPGYDGDCKVGNN